MFAQRRALSVGSRCWAVSFMKQLALSAGFGIDMWFLQSIGHWVLGVGFLPLGGGFYEVNGVKR